MSIGKNPPSLSKSFDGDVEHLEDIGRPATSIDYNRNVNAKILNPLAGISKEELLLRVSAFCVEVGLQEHLSVFQKGALVAQSPSDFENISELDEDDKYHLRREITHKWRLPKDLYWTIGVCSLGSAIQGWDNTGANGANLSFPEEFGISHNHWLVGFINSAPTIFGLASAWATDPLNSWLGRRGVIFLSGLFCVFPVLAQAFAQNWEGLLICRLFMGLGMGIKITTIPIMTSEASPAPIRGALVMSFQLWVAFGIFIGFCSNLVFYDIGRLAWRFQLAAAFVPAIPILILIWICPESPRWLLKKQRYQESFNAFCRLRQSPVMAARDLYYAHCQISLENDAFGGSTLMRRLRELFSVPRLRRGCLSGGLIMTAQQFSGINIMAFYSSTIFAEAGYSTKQCLLASFGFGLVNFVFAFPAIWTIDTFGRRNLLLFTFPNMAWCLVVAGCLFLVPDDVGARVPLIATFIYLFTAFYSPGIGPVPAVYTAECFPLSHREIGVAFCVCVNNLIASVLSLTFPPLLDGLTPTGAFGFYAGLNMLAFVLLFFIVPETRQRTLEELDYVFGVPTRRHASYQVGTWLPWAFKRYILLDKNAKWQPLYHFQGAI
ncbi:Sugar/inositol transporter [Macrophomina phaseolina MS6]|uniref:Sugar/inositol transporter n=1 Tax=Macrophomina phaseolina (strain MS6) TaxID=1126212 RepID=K2RCC6_MACPH|nr:Sugar/inositol transporter [Macrophomina phaseolina MS6]